MKLAAVAIASLVALSARAEAKCARPDMVAAFVDTKAQGAAIVETTNHWGSDDPGLGELKFTVDGKKKSFDKVEVAPGLVVYRLPANAKSGVIDGGKAGKATVKALDPKTPTLAAPKVKSITYVESRSGRGTNRNTTVVLDGAVPADAVALVAMDAKGRPLSWGPAKTEEGAPLRIYDQSRCGAVPDGTLAPDAGSVMLFWVDKFGRPSEFSARVTIVAQKSGSDRDEP
ncbi:MAG TPA: hypothetical protein VGM90_29900 [Kofleriaceae bacterium]|jgi:hypothetical protein